MRKVSKAYLSRSATLILGELAVCSRRLVTSPGSSQTKSKTATAARVRAPTRITLAGFASGPFRNTSKEKRMIMAQCIFFRSYSRPELESRSEFFCAAPGPESPGCRFLFRARQVRRYKLFFFISETAKSQARAVSAMYVSDGFTQAEEVMQPPSVTKRFFTSCA